MPDQDPETIDALIETLVQSYIDRYGLVEVFRDQLTLALRSSDPLQPLVHSFKSRLKDPDHLRDKLHRKAARCIEDDVEFDFTPETLLTQINDLAGVRILHLYTRQIRDIDVHLRAICEEQQYQLLEGPFARTWDDESREFFAECNIEVQPSPTMYTSVHYIIGSASRTTVTCEVQVRTLMEEVWGEVDHALNYPHPTEVLALREELKVLARVTSSATRLVDAIFATHEDAEAWEGL